MSSNSNIDKKIDFEETRLQLQEILSAIDKKEKEYIDLSTTINNNTNTNLKLKSKIQQLQTTRSILQKIYDETIIAINDIDSYGKLQQRSITFFKKEYNTLYTKVIDRKLLRFNQSTKTNDKLLYLKNKLESEFSNDARNSDYQHEQNKFFITLNNIFFWMYYIILAILCYYLFYIQTDMKFNIKILLIILLIVFPLSYYMYDVIM